jgi:hypothetical protein
MSIAHFELRPTDNLGTNGGIVKTDTPRQAARCNFSASIGVEQLARASITRIIAHTCPRAHMDPARADHIPANTGVEQLARACMSMHVLLIAHA